MRNSSIQFYKKQVAAATVVLFLINTLWAGPAFSQSALPIPTSMVNLTSGFNPTLMRGMRFYPDNPLRFDFIVTPGDALLQGKDFEEEATKLMKYFLSSLTVPEKDLWVNLSPYEKDRIIPEAYGKTEMGRDMLAQDYILKQLSASIIYPESEIGKSFWTAAYQKIQEKLGSTEGGVNTFNKIWIVPQKAVVYSKNNVAYVVESHLKVMLEEDYVALANQQAPPAKHDDISSQLFRSIVLPAIEKEVNEGRNFAPLRQVYHSLILATWFKRHLKESILSKVYVGQNKVDGVTFGDSTDKEKIYADYLDAFKKGVYNFIREEEDATTGEMVPRKYFSGGVMAYNVGEVLSETQDENTLRAAIRASSSVTPPGDYRTIFAEEDTAALDRQLAQGSRRPLADFFNRIRNLPFVISARLNSSGSGSNRSTTVNRTPSGNGSGQNEVFYFRSTPILEAGPTVITSMTADFSDTAWPFSQPNSLRDMASAFRIAMSDFQKSAVDTDAALRYLWPLIKKLMYQRISSSGGAATLYQQLSDRLERNRGIVGIPQQSAKRDLFKRAVNFILDSLDEEFESVLEVALVAAKGYIREHQQRIPEGQKVNIVFVVGSKNVFEFKRDQDGGLVLEVDLISFLNTDHEAHDLAWDYQLSDSAREAQKKNLLAAFPAKTDARNFIVNNPGVVVEVLKLIAFIENEIDPRFGRLIQDPQTEEAGRAELDKFLFQLSEDGGNRYVVQIIQTLVEINNRRQRIRAILNFINDQPSLSNAAGMQSWASEVDCDMIALYYEQNVAPDLSGWFSGRLPDETTSQAYKKKKAFDALAAQKAKAAKVSPAPSFQPVVPARPKTVLLDRATTLSEVIRLTYGLKVEDDVPEEFVSDFLRRNDHINTADDLKAGVVVNGYNLAMTVASETQARDAFAKLHGAEYSQEQWELFKRLNNILGPEQVINAGVVLNAILTDEQVADLRLRFAINKYTDTFKVEMTLGAQDRSITGVVTALYGVSPGASKYKAFFDQNSTGAEIMTDGDLRPGMVVQAIFAPENVVTPEETVPPPAPVVDTAAALSDAKPTGSTRPAVFTVNKEYDSLSQLIREMNGMAPDADVSFEQMDEFLRLNPTISGTANLRIGMKLNSLATTITLVNSVRIDELLKMIYGENVPLTEYVSFVNLNQINVGEGPIGEITLKAGKKLGFGLSVEQVLALREKLRTGAVDHYVEVEMPLRSSDTSVGRVFRNLYGSDGSVAEADMFMRQNDIIKNEDLANKRVVKTVYPSRGKTVVGFTLPQEISATTAFFFLYGLGGTKAEFDEFRNLNGFVFDGVTLPEGSTVVARLANEKVSALQERAAARNFSNRLRMISGVVLPLEEPQKVAEPEELPPVGANERPRTVTLTRKMTLQEVIKLTYGGEVTEDKIKDFFYRNSNNFPERKDDLVLLIGMKVNPVLLKTAFPYDMTVAEAFHAIYGPDATLNDFMEFRANNKFLPIDKSLVRAGKEVYAHVSPKQLQDFNLRLIERKIPQEITTIVPIGNREQLTDVEATLRGLNSREEMLSQPQNDFWHNLFLVQNDTTNVTPGGLFRLTYSPYTIPILTDVVSQEELESEAQKPWDGFANTYDLSESVEPARDIPADKVGRINFVKKNGEKPSLTSRIAKFALVGALAVMGAFSIPQFLSDTAPLPGEQTATPPAAVQIEQEPKQIQIDPTMDIKDAQTVERFHIVQPGESVWKIAKDFYGTSKNAQTSQGMLKIIGANPELAKNPNMIYEGQLIKIPYEGYQYTGGSYSSGVASSAANVGGINLDPSGLEIIEGGEPFAFDVPIEPTVLQSLTTEPVNGFVPEILNVAPILNLSQFLGVQN